MKTLSAFLIIMFLLVFKNNAQPTNNFIDQISANNLMLHVKKLASTDFEGREFASNGERLAAEYILTEINKVSTNSSECYLQKFSMEFDTLLSFQIRTKNTVLESFKDFNSFEWINWPDSNNLEIVYAGFGMELEHFNEYENIDLDGKIALIELITPLDSAGILLDSVNFRTHNRNYQYNKIKEIAEKKGAMGLILRKNADDYKKDYEWYKTNNFSLISYYPSNSEIYKNELGGLPTIVANQKTLDSLLGVTTTNFESKILKNLKEGKSSSGLANCMVDIEKSVEKRYEKSQNVICLIEGEQNTDAIVVTAHYDHAGIYEGVLYPGADDNASGTATLIELAKAFKNANNKGFKPKHPIIFVACAGEEKGFFGSEHYVKSELFKAYPPKLNINIDMIGRHDTTHYSDLNFVYAMFSNDSLNYYKEKLNNVKQASNLSLHLDYNYPYPEQEINSRSDQYVFANKNISTLFFFTGLHNDYHTPKDTPEKLHYANMEQISKLLFRYIWDEAEVHN